MKKKVLLAVICCLLLAVLVGCDGMYETPIANINVNGDEQRITYENMVAPNELMGNASAENSAFMFYVFDGEAVLSKIVFQDAPHRQGIIDELQSAPAARVTGWTLDDITLPIYGIRMGTTCGLGMGAAWSNGYWITQTGDVYRFGFDFETFIDIQRWESPHSHTNFSWFPNAINLTRDESGWSSNLLTLAETLTPPDGIEMALVSNTNEDVTFTLTNNNDDYWFYGMHFSVDARLDGRWYSIPTTPGNWAFVDIGLTLEAGDTQTKTYSLEMYGALPPGTYRLVVHDMYVVFDVENNF